MNSPQRLDTALQQWSQENPRFDLAKFQVISSIAMLGQELEVEFRALAQKIGCDIGPGELRILLLLRRSGHPFIQRPVDLARNLLVTSGAMTKQLSRLEAKGLVCRSRVKGQRGWQIQLTEPGGDLAMAAMEPLALPLFEQSLQSFPEDERASAMWFLRQLLERIERARELAHPSDPAKPEADHFAT